MSVLIDVLIGLCSAEQYISVSGSTMQASKMGTFMRIESTCCGRPVYQCTDPDTCGTYSATYLYYSGEWSGWVIGMNEECGASVGVAVFDSATTPDKVSAMWEAYDGSSWVLDPSLRVTSGTNAPTAFPTGYPSTALPTGHPTTAAPTNAPCPYITAAAGFPATPATSRARGLGAYAAEGAKGLRPGSKQSTDNSTDRGNGLVFIGLVVIALLRRTCCNQRPPYEQQFQQQQQQHMQVTLPAGAWPGQIITVVTPSGQMLQVQVPSGLGPGGSFYVSITSAQIQQSEVAVPDAAPVRRNAPVGIAALTTSNPLQDQPPRTDHQPSSVDPEAMMITSVNGVRVV
jgi:hypothetical protein